MSLSCPGLAKPNENTEVTFRIKPERLGHTTLACTYQVVLIIIFACQHLAVPSSCEIR